MGNAAELVQPAQFVISHATASSFASKKAIAHVDSFSLDDGFEVATVEDFDSVGGELAMQILGSRSASINFSVNMMPSDLAYKALMTAFKAPGTQTFLEIALADTLTTPTSAAIQLGGRLSNRNVTGQRPVATVSFTFVADEIISDSL